MSEDVMDFAFHKICVPGVVMRTESECWLELKAVIGNKSFY